MINYLIVYFSLFLIITSIIGYGFLLAKIVNYKLLNLDLGNIGILGLLFFVIISYFTIFFLKHDYLHNIIFHLVGLISFYYFYKKLKIKKEFYKLIYLTALFGIGFLVIKNHDDFAFYHLTYSFALTQDKINFGMGNLSLGYRHHSSLFFINSLLYLPIIKFYLFHSIAFITLIFANYTCLLNLLSKSKLKKFNYEYIYYLTIFIYINCKFYRIGEYGTDIAGQIIFLTILPKIISTFNENNNSKNLKTYIEHLFLVISYLITIKTYFVVYLLFSIIFLIKLKSKIFEFFIRSKATYTFLLTLLLLSMVNISYTGCAIYPLKETCFSNKIIWSLEKEEVQKNKVWYSFWSKAGATPNSNIKNFEKYIDKFNWLPNWTNKYFFNKGLENLIAILFISFLLTIIFYRNKSKNIKFNFFNKNYNLIYLILLVLFFEWFYQHPTLRYGGYSLLSALIFLPFSYFISSTNLKYDIRKKLVISLIIITISIFNIRNIKRINYEVKNYFKSDFPYFYVLKSGFKTHIFKDNIKVYIPENNGNGCWVTPTPCVGAVNSKIQDAKKIYGYNVFFSKK